jgi:carotenoid cleavage dioxygenase-like enzyme
MVMMHGIRVNALIPGTTDTALVRRSAGIATSSATEDRGWLLCEVLDGKSEKSFMAIFDAAHVNDGPIVRVHLHHHLPMSFHGRWQAAQA